MSGSNTPAVPNDIVLFWYHYSPYGRRVTWYLALRGIHYAECIQPPMLPRPDLESLGVNYRRSPMMAVGRDMYADTRLIYAKLEQMFPPSPEHPALSSPESVGIAALLNKFVIEGSVFREAVKQMPQSPLVKDPKFQKDRAGFFGPDWTMNDTRMMRPEGMVHMRQCFDIAESLFADGREWVAGTKELSLADLEGLWVFDWFISDLRPTQTYFAEQQYPKVYSWRSRFRKALNAAKARAPRTVSLKGEQAVELILSSGFSDRDTVVDCNDPTQLKEGTFVELFPTDGGGFTHQDRGRLVKLTKDEVAIAVQSKTGEEVRIHAPRWHFRVHAINEKSDGARL